MRRFTSQSATLPVLTLLIGSEDDYRDFVLFRGVLCISGRRKPVLFVECYRNRTDSVNTNLYTFNLSHKYDRFSGFLYLICLKNPVNNISVNLVVKFLTQLYNCYSKKQQIEVERLRISMLLLVNSRCWIIATLFSIRGLETLIL